MMKNSLVRHDECTRCKLFVLVDRMRIAYLDCFSGISGDMFLGALIDAGVPAKLFEDTVAALNIGARLEITRVNRSGITATKVNVIVGNEVDMPREEALATGKPENLHDDHDQAHAHARDHHGHIHHHAQEHAHGRGLKDINQIIQGAKLPDAAKTTAITIFEGLAAAESKIHNVPVDQIHFHEVGAVDALVDIVCAAVGANALHVEEWVCSPLNVGGGTVECAHGTLPVPAPATLELLQDAPVYSSGPQKELVTPTGAAIVRALASRYSTFPQMKVSSSGYGAGSRDFPGYPNVLRLTLGESQPSIETQTSQETVSVLEANLDDLNPQVFGYVMDRLLEEGALDVFGVPVQMKKSRPGMVLTVLARPEDVAKLMKVLFAETTTLGVRRRDEQRQVLQRRWITVTTKWGEVRMKVASLNGAISNCAPEYEDCRKLAAAHHVPLKAVMQEAMQQYAEAGNTK